MKEKVMWTVFAILVAVFNAVAVGAALLVIAPTISQAGAIARVSAGAVAGYLIAQRK